MRRATILYFHLRLAQQAPAALTLLVINKYSITNLNAAIIITNFFPWSATVRSSRHQIDTRTNGPAAAQDITTNLFVTASTNFITTFPPYSMTLLTFVPAAPKGVQTIDMATGNFIFQMQGQVGVPYQIQTDKSVHGFPIPPSC